VSDDPYKILGVARDADQDDIRKAYRKLAKELHPDLHPDDKAAETRFKQVSGAYGLLKDSEKRARFDRGEIDAGGAERQEHQYYRHHAEADPGGRYSGHPGFTNQEDLADFLSGAFSGRGAGRRSMRMKGQDAGYALGVEFLDAINGATRRLTLPQGGDLDVRIPPGIHDGATLRLKGKGGAGVGGGPAGDALITITVKPHALFRREGNDIVLDLPITLDEAVLGGKVATPTATGKVALTIPKGSSSGDMLRLKGKGVKPAKGTAGDQRVVLQITLPETVDAELEAFLETWREDHAYDPRAGMGKPS
jgi:DnaJ-class molecular chaperone